MTIAGRSIYSDCVLVGQDRLEAFDTRPEAGDTGLPRFVLQAACLIRILFGLWGAIWGTAARRSRRYRCIFRR